MKIKFKNLQKGDKVWVVYNKNYKEWNYIHPYNVLEIIRSATVLENKEVTVTISSSDRYSDDTWTKLERYIEIETSLQKYYRNYDEFYDNRGKMTMTSDYSNDGPTIEVFVDKEEAFEYLEKSCMHRISGLKKEIEDRQKQIELCEQSIKEAKEYIKENIY